MQRRIAKLGFARSAALLAAGLAVLTSIRPMAPLAAQSAPHLQTIVREGVSGDPKPAPVVHLPLVFGAPLPPPLGDLFLPMVFRDYAPPRPLFGVEMLPVGDAGGLPQAVAAGARWVRTVGFAWDLIEPVRTSPPTYVWSVVDEQGMRNAASNGLAYIGVVNFVPAWARVPGGDPCGPIDPGALPEFAEFLTALVRRYASAPYNVRYWEIWNEPDVDPDDIGPRSGFGCWGDKDDPYYGGGAYGAMLAEAYTAIKAASAQARVLVGGLLLDCDPRNPPPGKTCESAHFLEGILYHGYGDSFDGVGFHAYTYYQGVQGSMSNGNWPGSVTALPEKAGFLREVLDQYGYGQKPLYCTEAALLYSIDGSAARETQAVYVPRALADGLALGLPAQIYYRMLNDEERQDHWRNVGLLEADLDPKPAYASYGTAASFLSSVSYAGPAAGYPAGVRGYSFEPKPGAQPLDLIWSADGTPQDVPLPAGATAYDRYGALIGAGGTIAVDYGPVYVVLP